MTAPFNGRCACEAVSLQIQAEPLAIRQCWCRQCQTIAAGSPTNNAVFPAEAVTISGPLASSSWIAASGNTLTHTFCPHCGTQIFAQSSARPAFKTVRLGVIEEPHDLQPQAIIWTDEAPNWAIFDPGLKQFARQPPPPTAN
ncbi:GFA family protein [Novosphingobium sp.]|uniref:GFA family protein n=1 Tax=Novosphingobium sp. TaxID=1874826 RepID=UPI0025F4EBF1|nr:GFA family protein [Novosphingobium sp.]